MPIINMIALYISSNQFKIDNDCTTEFSTGRRVKLNCGSDGYLYSTILSSLYEFPFTIITITESVLTPNLSDVLYGIINTGPNSSFPDHTHDSSEGQGGLINYVSNPDFVTYSGVIQQQINSVPNSFIDLSDVPNSYIGTENMFAQSTGSGIQWASVSGNSSIQSFIDLIDTPDYYSPGLFAKSTISGIVWSTISGISDMVTINEFNSHNHDDYYYTELEVDSLITNISGVTSLGMFELDENNGLMPIDLTGYPTNVDTIITITSPNGSKWLLKVDNIGNLYTEAV